MEEPLLYPQIDKVSRCAHIEYGYLVVGSEISSRVVVSGAEVFIRRQDGKRTSAAR